jgi:hypothetical protein
VTPAQEQPPVVGIGGTACTREQALDWASKYLRSSGAYAYPSYDAYTTNGGRRLCDGDLLAPTLLNARPTIRAYESLTSCREQLSDALVALPDKDLAEASDHDLRAVASLYAPLVKGLPDVQGTTLSKVLHRKIPRLIPLYDEHILWCYRDAPRAPIPKDRERSWPEFMFALATALRADLARPGVAAVLHEVVGLARPDVPITPLRAWDILAWTAGKSEHRSLGSR